jgi:uncharacterized protein (TIGR02757 family)
MLPSENDLHAFLEEKHDLYNRLSFIENDPVLIPHLFSTREDIEVSGFLAATIAWGQRSTIIRNARSLMERMDNSPYDFLMNAEEQDLEPLRTFVHRTFNSTDLIYFLSALKMIYTVYGGPEKVFAYTADEDLDLGEAIGNFRKVFFSLDHPSRTGKHVSNPTEGSSAKRICMFLRWMVRKDKRGVDFGIWTKIRPPQLKIPLDVHSGRVARKLGLLKRTQNDWKAVNELTDRLLQLDPADPVKYDFALFGLGVNEKF